LSTSVSELSPVVGDQARLCMRRVRKGGDRLPLLVIHGMQCDTTFARALARELPEDQPVYAFRAPGLTGVEPPLSTTDEMAARYLEEAREVVGDDGFVLAGFCAGGVIAFEMARALPADYPALKRLFMIDVARTALTRRFELLLNQQVEIARRRQFERPDLAAKTPGAPETVEAFGRALQERQRKSTGVAYDGATTLVATTENLQSMLAPETGWRGLLPSETRIVVAGQDRQALMGEGLRKIASRVLGSTVKRTSLN
jgi:thioesterase domain-containing protein